MTTIKVDCPYCGDFKEAETVIIRTNSIVAVCPDCHNAIHYYGRDAQE